MSRYGRVDREKLKNRLVDECAGSTLVARAATDVAHFDDRASEVKLEGGGHVRGLVVVDATGFKRKFARHGVIDKASRDGRELH